MVRRSLLFVALVGVCAAIVAGAAHWVRQAPGARPPRLVLLVDADSAATRALTAGAVAAASDVQADLHVEAISNADWQKPNRLRLQLESLRPDGLVVGPIAGFSEQELEEIAGLNPALRVVTCQPHVIPARRQIHVGGSEYALGRRGAAAVRQVAAKASVTVTYDRHHPDIAFRLQGLEDALAGPSAKDPTTTPIAVRRELIAEDNVAETLRRLLNAPGNRRCLVCFNNTHTLAAARLQADATEDQRVVLVGFQPTDETYALLSAGRIDAVVAERPYELGRYAVLCTSALCDMTPLHQPAMGLGNAYLPPQIVTPRDVQRFLASRPEADG